MTASSFESILTDLVRQVGGPDRPGYLMLRGEPNPIVLVFAPREETPTFVFKGSRERLQADGESSRLQHLRESAPASFARTIPRQLGTKTSETGMSGVLFTALPGSRLKDVSPGRVFGPSTADATLNTVTRWLAGFHEVAGKLQGQYPPAGRRALIEQPVERYLNWFRVTDEEQALILEASAGLPDPGTTGLPHCLGHGDFSPANVLWDEGRIGVIDFEYALEPCLPLDDLLHFLASMKTTTSARDRENQRRGFFEEVFYGQGHLAQAARRAIRTLADRVTIAPETIEYLFVLCWVRLAVRSAEIQAHALGYRELLDDPDRLWKRLDAEPEEFLPTSRIAGGICGNVRQHVEMRERFSLASR